MCDFARKQLRQASKNIGEKLDKRYITCYSPGINLVCVPSTSLKGGYKMEEKNVVTDNNLDTKFEHKDYKSQSLNTFILT